jgi:hypothetical protein
VWEPTLAEAIAAWNRRADGWVSVEERLPELWPLSSGEPSGFSSPVLVAVKAVGDCTWGLTGTPYMVTEDRLAPEGVSKTDGPWENTQSEQVVAWREMPVYEPLPAPPERSEE